jgi:hypothetical protein
MWMQVHDGLRAEEGACGEFMGALHPSYVLKLKINERGK